MFCNNVYCHHFLAMLAKTLVNCFVDVEIISRIATQPSEIIEIRISIQDMLRETSSHFKGFTLLAALVVSIINQHSYVDDYACPTKDWVF